MILLRDSTMTLTHSSGDRAANRWSSAVALSVSAAPAPAHTRHVPCTPHTCPRVAAATPRIPSHARHAPVTPLCLVGTPRCLPSPPPRPLEHPRPACPSSTAPSRAAIRPPPHGAPCLAAAIGSADKPRLPGPAFRAAVSAGGAPALPGGGCRGQ